MAEKHTPEDGCAESKGQSEFGDVFLDALLEVGFLREKNLALVAALEGFFAVYDREDLIPLEAPEFDAPIDAMRAAIAQAKGE